MDSKKDIRESLFKTASVADRAQLLPDFFIDIMADMYAWCTDKKMPFMVTDTVSTYEEDMKLKRISTSHRERRAFDLSVHGWSELNIKDFIEHFNFKYFDLAAIPLEEAKGNHMVPTLVVDETNRVDRAPHLHVQIHKRYAFKFDA